MRSHTRARIRGRAAIGVVLTVLVGAGCVVPPGPSSDPPRSSGSPRPSPSTVETPAAVESEPPSSASFDPIALDPPVAQATLPPPCLSHATVYDRLVTTPDMDAARSTSVVIGWVEAIGAVWWNTNSGQPPGRDAEPMDVLRLVRIQVEQTVAGAAVPAAVTVWVPGGRIGCHDFWIAGSGPFEPGARFLLFLDDGRARAPIGDAQHAWRSWAIDGNEVHTEFGGTRPLRDVLAQIAARP